MVEYLETPPPPPPPAPPQPAGAALDVLFGALADPTRRQILTRLREGETTVGALAAPFPISLAAVSKHLKVLERAGLLRREVRGREHVISLEARPLRVASEWVGDYQELWSERLDALDAMLRRRAGDEPPTGGGR